MNVARCSAACCATSASRCSAPRSLAEREPALLGRIGRRAVVAGAVVASIGLPRAVIAMASRAALGGVLGALVAGPPGVRRSVSRRPRSRTLVDRRRATRRARPDRGAADRRRHGDRVGAPSRPLARAGARGRRRTRSRHRSDPCSPRRPIARRSACRSTRSSTNWPSRSARLGRAARRPASSGCTAAPEAPSRPRSTTSPGRSALAVTAPASCDRSPHRHVSPRRSSGLLPFGFFLFLSVVARRDVETAYHTTAGASAIGIGLALQGLAFVWIRHLLRVEEA